MSVQSCVQFFLPKEVLSMQSCQGESKKGTQRAWLSWAVLEGSGGVGLGGWVRFISIIPSQLLTATLQNLNTFNWGWGMSA